jgi:hypothetical protein
MTGLGATPESVSSGVFEVVHAAKNAMTAIACSLINAFMGKLPVFPSL